MNLERNAAPRIGIPLPTSRDLEYNRRCWPEYAEAVRQAGGLPVELSLENLTASVIDSCGAFVLPGSPADVEPGRYGQIAAPETAAADAVREACDLDLLAHAANAGKPVLGICFGLQMLNVWRGGTLLQDLSPLPVNHAAGAQVAAAHAALVDPRSMLAGLLTASEAPSVGAFRRLIVNSSHHQAVGIAGEDLSVVARSAEDGVVEAVEGRIGDAPMLGVQWHPERSIGGSAASRALFLWLVSEAFDRMGGG